MKKDMISIIIPIYNTGKYLKKCLDSIVNQSYRNLEIILINDGSTDNSLNICNEYKKKDNRIKVLNKKNEGVSSARNDGIELSTGKYIVFIDPDDYVSNKHIEMLYDCIINNNVDLVISNGIDVLEDGTILKNKITNNFFMTKEQCLKELLIDKKFNNVCWGNIYKKEILRKCKFNCNYRIAEDLDFLYKYIKNLNSAYFLGENTYYWLKREGSATNSKYTDKWNDELEICKYIINDTSNISEVLNKYAKGKYIKVNIKQAERFNLNKKQIELFRSNIKVYKDEILNHKEFSKIYKLKMILFLKSYTLFKLTLNIKNKVYDLKK